MLKILELFAGVGGFRVGLERANKNFFVTHWSNQWEPTRKAQHAFNCYNAHFTDSININRDISTIQNTEIAKFDADMIVGGFPCQDYSVARSLKGEMGIKGKKGTLFWEIIRFTKIIQPKIIQPKYIILENVDRLLKSPASQRGRDFGIMLSAFNNLGYAVEGRVVNAADYGMAQRRRRVFLFIYKNNTNIFQKFSQQTQENLIYKNGIFAKAFPVEKTASKNRVQRFEINPDYTVPLCQDKFFKYDNGLLQGSENMWVLSRV